VAHVHLPSSLVSLFPGAPRQLELDAGSVAELMAGLNERWPGMRDRLCTSEPAIRRHINVFVDGERSKLDTPVASASVVHVVPSVSGG
jgi:sulfur-carrier protein